MGRDCGGHQQRSSRESKGIRPGHGQAWENVSKPAEVPLKPTQPGLAPPSRIAKGRRASVQMTRCCQEIVFKSALAPVW